MNLSVLSDTISGMDTRDLRQWMEFGHRVAPVVHRVLWEGNQFLVLGHPQGGYVQVHAKAGDGCYAEADSGEWTDLPLTPAQHDMLRVLGWRRPDEYQPRQERWNYWLDLDLPIDEYGLVVLLVRTMAEVFGAQPDTLEVKLTECDCCNG